MSLTVYLEVVDMSKDRRHFWESDAGVLTVVMEFRNCISSNAVAPFASTYDGFYLENDGTTIRLKAERAGVTTIDVPWTSWDNYALISTYDWSKFTVIAFDFLWLGSEKAIMRASVEEMVA